MSSPGTTIYAGNGDGTFQTTPFYTVPLPQNTYANSFATADVNGDGNPDLLLVQTGNAPPYWRFIWETETATLRRYE